MTRRLTTMLPALVAAGTLLVAGCGGEEPAPPPPLPESAPENPEAASEVSEPLSPDPLTFTADGVADGTVDFEEFRGKVVLVDFFGTWCPPCRASTPVLVSLYERYHDQGFEVVGLAYERTQHTEDAKAAVQRFAEQYHIPYTLALGPRDIDDQLPGGLRAFPTMVLVDREGLIRDLWIGYDEGHGALLTDAIETRLDGK